MPPLRSAKREAFCRHYVAMAKPNGTEAAKLAGFSAKSAHAEASRLLKDVKVFARIAELQAEAMATAAGQARVQAEEQVAAEIDERAARVVQELEYIAHADPAGLEAVLPIAGIAALPEELRRCIAGIDVTERWIPNADGDPQREVTYKLRFWDKVAALRLLGTHHALLEGRKKSDDDEPREVKVTMIIPKAAG